MFRSCFFKPFFLAYANNLIRWKKLHKSLAMEAPVWEGLKAKKIILLGLQVLLVSNSLLQPLVGWRFAHSQKAKMFGKTQGVGFCLASFRVELLSWEIKFHLGIIASWALMIHTGQKIIHTNMVGAWNFPSIEHAHYLLHLIHCPILPFKTGGKKKYPYHLHDSHHAMKCKIFLRKSSQIAA